MKHVYLLLLTFATAFFLLSPAHAQQGSQGWQQGQVSVHAGLALPSGEFGEADVTEESSGFATLGAVVMGQYTYPIAAQGLGWTSSIALAVNRVDGPAIEEALVGRVFGVPVEDFEEAGIDVNIDTGYWFNIPVMTGLKYQSNASATLDLYGLGQAGLNVNRGPKIDFTASAEGEELTASQSFSTATSFGFTVGAGILFNDQINVSLRYFDFNTPELTTEAEATFDGATESEEDTYNQPLAGIQLLVGITL